MGGYIHATDIRPDQAGRSWPYEKIRPDERLREGDVVYLRGSYGGLYAWGFVMKKEPYRDEELGDVLRLNVSRPVIRQGLVPTEAVSRVPELVALFERSQTSLEKLSAREVNALNRLLRAQGAEAPPDVSEDEDLLSAVGRLTARSVEEELVFTLGQPVRLEETRHTEFKEIFGGNPADSIKHAADEYAVAFLNSEGGRILWGIRNGDRVVVGVKLNYKQRDDVRREVSVKLSQIQPPVPPADFRLNVHPVLDDEGQEISDLHVVEVRVPRGKPDDLYATAGGDVWVRVDGGKRKLDHMQKIAEIKRRLGR